MTSNLTIHYLLLKPRLSLSFACFMSALLLWAKQRETLGLVTLLTLPVVSFDSIAVVVGGFVLYGILRFRKQRPTILRAAILYGIFLACAILLYQLFGNKIVSIYNPSVILKQEFALTRNGVLFPPLFFLRGFLQITVLYSFHLLMLYWFVRYHGQSRFHDALLLSTLMMVAGIAAWSLLFAMFDSIQVMTSFLVCYQTLLLILGVVLLSKVKRGAGGLIGGYICIGSAANFFVFCLPYLGGMHPPLSKEYLNAVRSLSPSSKIGVSIQSKEDFGPWHMRNIAFPLGSNYLPFMPHYLKAVEVGIFDIPATPFRARPNKVPLMNITVDFTPIDAYRSRTWKEGSAFYRYVQRMRQQQPQLTIEQAQVGFMDLHKIDWAILSRNASIDPLMQQRIEREIRDPVSGERFLLLKSTRQ
ncbi:MAG TPA: hypothetical protein VJ521_06305, partial [Acidobacteriota bacterium]|nr:hypothetical protein [Acidobacteriota bacterium]